MKRTLHSMALILLLTLGAVPSTFAQVSETQLLFMPHCTETDRSKCTAFAVLDPTHLTTTRLKAGDILDLDVVLRTKDPAKVATVRSWISFDKTVLEARNIELTAAMNAPYPGEQMIDASQGLIKIGAAINEKITAPETVLARVTFRVMKNQADSTISFSGYLPTGMGQVAVNTPRTDGSATDGGPLPPPPCFDVLLGCQEGVSPMLAGNPSALVVDLADAPLASSASSQSSSAGTIVAAHANSVETTTQAQVPQQSSFPLLQVQDVVATTRGSDVYVGWKELKSAENAGYNVYYGTISGRYMQRHSVPKEENSYVIRDLEPGVTYFIAVRAFSTANIESAFSQEVSVAVGKPETATRPLTGFEGTSAQNPYTPTGKNTVAETGTTSVIAILSILSALTGTFFAWRRQLSLRLPHA